MDYDHMAVPDLRKIWVKAGQSHETVIKKGEQQRAQPKVTGKSFNTSASMMRKVSSSV